MISLLLEAAEYLEVNEYNDKRGRDSEHGYASTQREPVSIVKRKAYSRRPKSQGNRSTHNQLEKNRRMQLKQYLEDLKSLIPLSPDSTRHTTQGLLRRATEVIKTEQDRDRRQRNEMKHLASLNRQLQRRRELLQKQKKASLGSAANLRQCRSISECSTGSSSSESSSHSAFSVSSQELGFTPRLGLHGATTEDMEMEQDYVDVVNDGSDTNDGRESHCSNDDGSEGYYTGSPSGSPSCGLDIFHSPTWASC